MHTKRITVIAVAMGMVALFFALTPHKSQAITRPEQDVAPAQTGALESVTYFCNAAVGPTVNCMLLSPKPWLPTESFSIPVASAYTVSARLDLTGTTYPAQLLDNSIWVELSNSHQLVTEGVTGTLLSPTSLVVTATNLHLTAPATNVTFDVSFGSAETVEAQFRINIANGAIVPQAYLPQVSGNCKGDVNNDWCEKHDAFDNAYATVVTETITATVNLSTDRRDYYRVKFDDKKYNIDLKKQGSSTADLDLYIYDMSRTLKCRSSFTNVSDEQIRINQLPCSKSSQFTTTLLPAGEYYILVYEFSGSAAANIPYTLKFTQP